MKKTRDDVKLTVNTLVWHIKTQFKGAQKRSQIIIRLGPKSSCGKFSFSIPAKGTQNSKKTAIVFKKGSEEGLNPRFGEFLCDRMKAAVKKWKDLEQMRNWVTKKHLWKQRVRSQWMNKRKRVTRNSGPLVEPISKPPSVMIKPRGKRSISIPVPQVMHNGNCAAITVYPRPEGTDNKGRVRKAQVIVWISRHICRHAFNDTSLKKGKEISMGFRFGDCKKWTHFVAEYITYAVSKLQTPTRLSNWVKKGIHSFKELLNIIYDFGGYHAPSAPPRTFRVAKSTMKFDPEEIGDIKDSGFGLFCTVAGKHTFPFYCPEPRVARLVDKRKELLTNLQKTYQAVGSKTDTKSNIVWVPSREALTCWAVLSVYLIQHRNDNPTHVLEFDEDDNVCLKPLRRAIPPEEYCFDYRWRDSPCDSPVQSKLLKKHAAKEKTVSEGAAREKTASQLAVIEKTTVSEGAAKEKTVSEGAAKKKTVSEKKDRDEGPFKDPMDNRFYVPEDVHIDAPRGSCLFVVIQHQLLLLGGILPLLTHKELRKIAVDFQLGGGLTHTKTTRQLNHMLKPTTYATDFEMCALCMALNVNIRVKNTRNRSGWTNAGGDYREGRPTLRIMLDFHSNMSKKNHYITLRPLADI